jgi:superfamily II DNA/RNA helicase
MSFASLGLNEAILKAVADSGYDTATEVQAQAIPAGIAGKDLMVSASTSCPPCSASSKPVVTTPSAARRA